jgi:hypothetical protein
MSRKGALTKVLFDLPYPLGTPYLVTCTAFIPFMHDLSQQLQKTEKAICICEIKVTFHPIPISSACKPQGAHIIIPLTNQILKYVPSANGN